MTQPITRREQAKRYFLRKAVVALKASANDRRAYQRALRHSQSHTALNWHSIADLLAPSDYPRSIYAALARYRQARATLNAIKGYVPHAGSGTPQLPPPRLP